MSGLLMPDYKINIMRKEYVKFSSILYNFQTHIENSYSSNIITLTDRTILLNQIDEFIKSISNIYNLHISEAESENNNVVIPDFKNIDNINNIHNVDNIDVEYIYDNMKALIPLYKKFQHIKYYENLAYDPYNEIRQTLINVGEKYGFYNFSDALILLVGDNYETNLSEENKNIINFCNKFIVLTKFKYLEIKPSDDKIEFNKNINVVSDALLDNNIEIVISIGNTKVTFEGYQKPDSINIIIRTSQICHNFIYRKRKELELIVDSNVNQILNETKNTFDQFKKSYYKNLSVCDILIYDKTTIMQKYLEDYQIYNDLSRQTFVNLMKEFTNDNIKKMFKIIKLLLLGSNENINIACLLYGLTKDKKHGSEYIANIIYKNLNFISQNKIKQASVNIKTEIEKVKAMTIDDVDLRKQLAICKNIPNNAKRAAFEKIEEMKASNNDYYKQLLYVRTLLNYPWTKDADDKFFQKLNGDPKAGKLFLEDAFTKLSNKVYGHTECKDEIQQIIGKWISNPAGTGTAIGLVGPPGVGKTLIAKGLGEALGIPFVQITLGGQNDGELLHGHGYTYSGAQPGLVVKKMVEAGSSRCVIYLDELDKACKKHDSNEIFNILIHMIDPNTNGEFQDRFFQEVTFPLSKVIFVFSYNDSHLLDSILRDRIKEISVKAYSLQDKIKISKEHLLKEVCKSIGFNPDLITIEDTAIEYIIENYTNEAGVRNLLRKFDKILSKLNVDKIYQRGLYADINNLNKTTIITVDMINEYLSKPDMTIRKIHSDDMVGVINGMYATDLGKGGIIPIQIYGNYIGSTKQFTLKLTGNQGKVMRESIMYSFTTAVNLLTEINKKNINTNFPSGLHIHTPDGSTPKDGPSAGCAFVVAFLSRLLNKPIKHDVAMTGEVEVTSKITAIGGLTYKLYGAKKAGIKKVYIPKQNEKDFDKIKEEYKGLLSDDFQVVLVDNVLEIAKEVLIGFDSNDFLI